MFAVAVAANISGLLVFQVFSESELSPAVMTLWGRDVKPTPSPSQSPGRSGRPIRPPAPFWYDKNGACEMESEKHG